MKILRSTLGATLVMAAVFMIASNTSGPGPGPLSRRDRVSTDNAYVQGDITPISPRISGYISEAAVHDHQVVREGDLLFRIEDDEYLARRDESLAALQAREAELQSLAIQVARQEALIRRADAAVSGAKADAHRTDLDLTRVRNLSSRGAESKQAEERAEAEQLKASASLLEAMADLDANRRQVALLQSQQQQAAANILAAKAALKLASIDLANTRIRAPSDGQLAERQAREGQYVRPGTLLVALVGSKPWVIANFKETQLSELRIGDDVEIQIDAVPDSKFHGYVEAIAPASGARFALLPPDNATGNFTRIVQRIPVKIRFAEGQPQIDILKPGMSALVSTP